MTCRWRRGTNYLTITAVNAAGVSNITSLAVVQGAVTLTIQDVPGGAVEPERR